MTMDERVEAAKRAILCRYGNMTEKEAELLARMALHAGVPEFHGDKPTHWLAPWEITDDMIDAVDRIGGDDDPGWWISDYEWDRIRDAYLGKGDGG